MAITNGKKRKMLYAEEIAEQNREIAVTTVRCVPKIKEAAAKTIEEAITSNMKAVNKAQRRASRQAAVRAAVISQKPRKAKPVK